MRNGKRSSPPAPRGYLLSHQAHFVLLQARNRLHLLAQLAEPRELDETGSVLVSTAGLADCFDQLASDLDEVLNSAVPSP